jgi:hypothetical protein
MSEVSVVDDCGAAVRYFEERAQAIGAVLAVPVDLAAEEGLREAAFRAVGANAFRNTGIVIELARVRSFRSLASLNEGSIEEVNRLVDVLGIRKDAETAKALLANKGFAGKDWVRYFGLNIRRSHLTKGRRVAPQSLRKLGRQEAVWSLRPFDFDLKTMEMLLDRCPRCSHALGWRRTFGPAFCDRCPAAGDPSRGGVYLPDFPQPSADVADDEAIAFEASLVDPAAPSYRRPLHADLADKGPGDVFQLSIEIASVLDERPAGWGGAIRTRSVEQAARALMEWPLGFHDLLDRHAEEKSSGKEGPLERLHYGRRLSVQMRAMLKKHRDRRQQARVLAIVGGSPSKVIRPGTMKNTASEVGVLLSTRQAITTGEAAVLLLRQSGDAKRIAVGLGLPIPYLVDLFEDGLLPELQPLLGGLLTVRSEDVVSIVDTVDAVSAVSRTRECGMPVWSAAFAAVNLNGRRWSQILRASMDGRLRLELLPGRSAFVRRLQFAGVQDADFGFLTREDDGSAIDEVPLTCGELSEALGKSRRVVSDLVEHAVLPEKATGKDLAAFRHRWMFTTEIGDLAILLNREDLIRPRPVLLASGVPRLGARTISLWSRTGMARVFPASIL